MPSFSFLRFRYSLRALLVLMTAFALFLGYHLNWIHQRRAAIDSGSLLAVEYSGDLSPPGPGLLWLFNERGYDTVFVPNDSEDTLKRARALFPEANFVSPADGGALESDPFSNTTDGR